jgi:hypothetical protein
MVMPMVTLSNGIQLQAIYMVKPNEDASSKAALARVKRSDLRTVFMGDETGVECSCANCEINKDNVHIWPVEREGDSITIGCVKFTAADVKAVKQWLNRKKVTL